MVIGSPAPRPARVARVAGAALAALVAPLAVVAHQAPAHAETAVRNTRVYATTGIRSSAETMWALTVDGRGDVVRRTALNNGIDTAGIVTDVADGQLLFTRRNEEGVSELWLRNRLGHSRRLTAGRTGIFTPYRQGAVVVNSVPKGEYLNDTVSIYSFRTGRLTRLFSYLSDERVIWDVRYSLDGRRLWILRRRSSGSSIEPTLLISYHLATRRFGRRTDLDYCYDMEMLPSGLRLLVICVDTSGGPSELRALRLSDGATVLRKTFPDRSIYRIRGRLNDLTLLASARTLEGKPYLGALDLRDYSVRRLANSSPMTFGAADYY